MKITSIERFPLQLKPVKVGYRLEDDLSTVTSVDTVIIRINTDAGIYGLGEAATIRSYFNQTLGILLDWLSAYETALIGEDPRNIIGIHRKLHLISGEKPPGCHPARAAIDMALHDLRGKAHNCPVYELLGGAYRTEFTMQTNLYEESVEAKVQAAKEFVINGFKGLKVKVGESLILSGFSTENLVKEKEKLKAVLEAVPGDIFIDADSNQAWGSTKTTVGIVEEILRDQYYPNLSIEQPLHYLDIDGHAFLRRALKVPLILDESVISPEAMIQIVKRDAADRIVLKMNRVGGYQNARRIIDICEAASIGVSIDTMPFTLLGDTAHCHLAATIRDPYPVDAEGHLWFEDTPFSGGIKIHRGKVTLPDSPGIGVDIDMEKLSTMLIDEKPNSV